MNAQDLKKLLEKSNDKFNIFQDRELLIQYQFNVLELVDLVNTFLSDEQKAKLFELAHFKKLSTGIKTRLINTITNDEIKLSLFKDSDVLSGFYRYEIMDLIQGLSDDGKVQILHDSNFLQKHEIKKYDIPKIIKSLSDEKKRELLANKSFIQDGLKLEEYEISSFVAGLETEEAKLELDNIYNFKNNQKKEIFKTFSDKSKTEIILKNPYEFKKNDLIGLISTLGTDSLVEFLKDNKEFLAQNDISVYKITKSLDKESQLHFISRFEEIDLTLQERRQILATLNKDTKSNIDISSFPPEYVSAIEMQIPDDVKNLNLYGKIVVDLNKDLESYRGLDELMYINPMQISTAEKQKLFELCQICPTISISDELGLSSSTAEEYVSAEKWIEDVLQGMNPEWSNIQKVAYIDNSIGKKISYSPDFDTEVFDHGDARALWKIIHSGYGVCNGIAQVEKYILDKIGIESEIVSSGIHSFLKLKGIELPRDNGEMVIGDTVLDPTWNLTAHRYGCRPQNFCRSYSEIRKSDIRSNGDDAKCHANDQELASATLDLEEKSLRKIFTSIGLADKEGDFPVKALIDKCVEIENCGLPQEETIKKLFSALEEYCPDFATCQNSTMSMLQGIILNQETLNFDKCVVNRVYERDDQSKSPVVYVYMNLPQNGKKFYFADKGQFVELPQKEFETKFECYEMDMEKQNGHRPWEDFDRVEEIEDLSRSSGKIVSSEGDER